MLVSQTCARKSLRCDHFLRRSSTMVDIVFHPFCFGFRISRPSLTETVSGFRHHRDRLYAKAPETGLEPLETARCARDAS
jgi:hypothetical protein